MPGNNCVLNILQFKVKLNEVVNGSFAVLMLVCLVFFLIYGVEIFCKVCYIQLTFIFMESFFLVCFQSWSMYFGIFRSFKLNYVIIILVSRWKEHLNLNSLPLKSISMLTSINYLFLALDLSCKLVSWYVMLFHLFIQRYFLKRKHDSIKTLLPRIKIIHRNAKYTSF